MEVAEGRDEGEFAAEVSREGSNGGAGGAFVGGVGGGMGLGRGREDRDEEGDIGVGEVGVFLRGEVLVMSTMMGTGRHCQRGISH